MITSGRQKQPHRHISGAGNALERDIQSNRVSYIGAYDTSLANSLTDIADAVKIYAGLDRAVFCRRGVKFGISVTGRYGFCVGCSGVHASSSMGFIKKWFKLR